MKHVFVETNWVVASSAPVHERMPAALDLVERAQRGEIRLHLPSICLGEARYPIRSKYQPRTSADAIRKFLTWTALQQDSEITDTAVIRRTLDRFETRMLAELDGLPAKQLRDDGEEEFYFCELDGDLQPWDKKGASKQPLASLYDRAHLWVYQDFSMNYPSPPPGFFGRQD